jgi:hypothetical protein
MQQDLFVLITFQFGIIDSITYQIERISSSLFLNTNSGLNIIRLRLSNCP